MSASRHYPYVGPEVEDVSGKCLVCGEHWPCTTERDLLARWRKARVADRRHTERHMVDPDYLRDRA